MYEECFLKEFFERVFLMFFITLHNYVNSESDKTETLMNLKIKRYQPRKSIIKKYEILKKKNKKKLKAFQNIDAIFKINSIDSRFFVFICRACRICSRSALISCSII